MVPDNGIELSNMPVRSREDFLVCLEHLISDYRRRGDSWENPTLDRYLEAIWAWSRDMDGYYRNKGETVDLDKPTWQMFADILRAARVYE